MKPAILAVLPSPEERLSLREILSDSRWKIRFTRTFEETLSALRRQDADVIIAQDALPNGASWRDLRYQMDALDISAPLIVVSRQANDLLWAEVLNLGGYDLLATPFDCDETLRVVAQACRSQPARAARS